MGSEVDRAEIENRTAHLPSVYDPGHRIEDDLAVGFVGTALYWWSFVSPTDRAIEQRFAREPVTLEGDDAAAAGWLRRHVGPEEIVYRESFRASFGYAEWAGVSTPWTENRAVAFGFPVTRLEQREAVLYAPPEALGDYLGERILWLVHTPGDAHVERLLRSWIPRGLVNQVASFGELRIYQLTADEQAIGTNATRPQ